MSDESQRKQEGHPILEFILTNREEADRILDELKKLIPRWGYASVGQLYMLLGIPDSYLDAYWGWRDLQSAKVVQHEDGYQLNLPSVENLADESAKALVQKIQNLHNNEM